MAAEGSSSVPGAPAPGACALTGGAYGRPADPPPGPSWRGLVGKRHPRVALVSLYVRENTGIRLLTALLERRGCTVHEVYFKDWVNNRLAAPTDAEWRLLMEELHRIGPDLVGLSVRASAFHRLATVLTERIRRELCVPVLWGGMHAASCPEDAARVADLVCVGEAEDPLCRMVDRLRGGGEPTGIPGLWVHTGDGLLRSGAATLVQDLDALPYPDYHGARKVLIEDGRAVRGDPYVHEPIYLVMASRGCPFPSCTFCSNSVAARLYGGQRYFRLRSLDHVLGEVRYARGCFDGLRRVRFDDEEFPVRRSWLEAFCRRWPREVGLPFEVHMDPRVVTAERVGRLREAGLASVYMGIQSTAAVNRELYCRDVSDEQVLAAARVLGDSGVRVGYQVILDDPYSGPEDKRRLFDLLLRLPLPYELILFSLAVYPGSALADDLLRRGLLGEDQVEGRATKVFRQFRVDLAYPRPVEDQFWTALCVLVSKDFVPRRLLRALCRSEALRRDPRALLVGAYAANVVKLGQMGLSLAARGELTLAVARRWLGLKTLVTF